MKVALKESRVTETSNEGSVRASRRVGDAVARRRHKDTESSELRATFGRQRRPLSTRQALLNRRRQKRFVPASQVPHHGTGRQSGCEAQILKEVATFDASLTQAEMRKSGSQAASHDPARVPTSRGWVAYDGDKKGHIFHGRSKSPFEVVSIADGLGTQVDVVRVVQRGTERSAQKTRRHSVGQRAFAKSPCHHNLSCLFS